MSVFAANRKTPIADMFDSIRQGSVVAISLADDETLSNGDRKQLVDFIEQSDQLARLHAPSTPPSLCIESACWAAQTMHFFVRILLNRIETEVNLPASLAASEPSGTEASHHWSVDLVFRVLPDLERRCSAANSLDPLRNTIRQVAGRWPLSATGIECEFAPKAKDTVLESPSLRRELLDRVYARGGGETVRWPELKRELSAIEADRSLDGWT